MSELEEKVKELICVKCKKPECMVPFNEACDYRNRYVKSILALIPKYEMEVECPECRKEGVEHCRPCPLFGKESCIKQVDCKKCVECRKVDG